MALLASSRTRRTSDNHFTTSSFKVWWRQRSRDCRPAPNLLRHPSAVFRSRIGGRGRFWLQIVLIQSQRGTEGAQNLIVLFNYQFYWPFDDKSPEEFARGENTASSLDDQSEFITIFKNFMSHFQNLKLKECCAVFQSRRFNFRFWEILWHRYSI